MSSYVWKVREGTWWQIWVRRLKGKDQEKKIRKLQRNFHTLMWVYTSCPESREGTFSPLRPPPLFFFSASTSLPTFSLCLDNRGHGGNNAKRKGSGFVWQQLGGWSEVLRGENGWEGLAALQGGSEESGGGFLFQGGRVLMRGMYRKSAGMRGDVKEDDIRLGKGGVGWKGAASVEGNTSTWPMGPSGLCFCGTDIFLPDWAWKRLCWARQRKSQAFFLLHAKFSHRLKWLTSANQRN